jgi:hypothetical protein
MPPNATRPTAAAIATSSGSLTLRLVCNSRPSATTAMAIDQPSCDTHVAASWQADELDHASFEAGVAVKSEAGDDELAAGHDHVID